MSIGWWNMNGLGHLATFLTLHATFRYMKKLSLTCLKVKFQIRVKMHRDDSEKIYNSNQWQKTRYSNNLPNRGGSADNHWTRSSEPLTVRPMLSPLNKQVMLTDRRERSYSSAEQTIPLGRLILGVGVSNVCQEARAKQGDFWTRTGRPSYILGKATGVQKPGIILTPEQAVQPVWHIKWQTLVTGTGLNYVVWKYSRWILFGPCVQFLISFGSDSVFFPDLLMYKQRQQLEFLRWRHGGLLWR